MGRGEFLRPAGRCKMQKLDRNSKEQQRQLRNAQLEAEQFINDLHQILKSPRSGGISVGQMISAAAAGGFLRSVRAGKKVTA